MTVSKAELERRLDRFAEVCARAGVKITHQRVEVFREVAASDTHPDAEAVYLRVRKRMPHISRDTVYRTLATLESMGLLRRTEIAGGPTRYDANTESHHHFVCSVCGLVKDFRSEALDDLPIPRRVKAFGRIEAAQVQVRGVCSACIGKKAKARRRSS